MRGAGRLARADLREALDKSASVIAHYQAANKSVRPWVASTRSQQFHRKQADADTPF